VALHRSQINQDRKGTLVEKLEKRAKRRRGRCLRVERYVKVGGD
jgi:hypothetical protein